MQDHKISIKGMVCGRCVLAIRQKMQELQIPVTRIGLGEVITRSLLSGPDMEAVQKELAHLGFTLLENKKFRMVREVKALVDHVYSGSYDFGNNFKFSGLASKQLNRDYKAISSVFNELEQTTIEQYIIEYRIEKVKELLVYTEDTLSDIAFRLGFSSAAYLSRQFKFLTGLNTSHFKEVRRAKSIQKTGEL
ncbi:helix-turn-helix domain-containing protein [Niabella beijingensis]|uniref:helix-turn-helix domain-containing protein n=1 Tax=Niabella beijingensis TaxID=2872700 RepID=UPI001CBC632B|nr:AraC family transcriptional regulator [Niabella beijingensis]MBZ4192635.1 AraC family transcriptional regulator [Niabella beijingensis]